MERLGNPPEYDPANKPEKFIPVHCNKFDQICKTLMLETEQEQQRFIENYHIRIYFDEGVEIYG